MLSRAEEYRQRARDCEKAAELAHHEEAPNVQQSMRSLSHRLHDLFLMRNAMSTLTPAGKKHAARVNAMKRSVDVGGHKTSVSLEDEFWDGLHEVARHKNLTVSELVATIASGRDRNNLSSAVRVFVLNHFRTLGGQKLLSNEPGRDTPIASRGPFAAG
jgi:predicted DNA-binding ribbon-helix-helix protein